MINIKKCLAAVLAVVILSLAIPFSGAFAAGEKFVVTLSCDKAVATRGGTVTVTALVEDITAQGGLLSVDIPFRYDTNVFEFVSATAILPTQWEKAEDFSYTAPKNGLLWLRSVNNTQGFTVDYGCAVNGAIGFKVTLKVKANADMGGSAITVNGSGAFEVICGTAADGACTEVLGSGAPLTVNVGEYIGTLGDLNADTAVDNTDAAVALKYDAGIMDLEEKALEAGDVNADGFVDNTDASVILKYDAGLLENLG